jgi:hypothetical protein
MPIWSGITRCNGFAAKSNQERQEWGYCTPTVLHCHGVAHATIPASRHFSSAGLCAPFSLPELGGLQRRTSLPQASSILDLSHRPQKPGIKGKI